jgi:hypothetical protein
MSFCFSITGAAVLLAAVKNPYTWRRKILMFIISAVLYGFGWLLKPTSCISLFALLLILLLYSQKSGSERESFSDFRFWILAFLSFAAIFAAIIFTSNLLKRDLPENSPEMIEAYRMPPLFWIGLGLSHDGTYIANYEGYANELSNKIRVYQTRDNFVKDHISKNFNNFFDIDHLKSKALYNFTQGDLHGLYDARITKLPLSEYLDFQNATSAKLFYKYRIVTQAVWWFLCILLLKHSIEQLLSLCINTTGQDQHILQMDRIPELIGDLTSFGIVLFLMIWEANAKQLYNSYPWILYLATISIYSCKTKKAPDQIQ